MSGSREGRTDEAIRADLAAIESMPPAVPNDAYSRLAMIDVPTLLADRDRLREENEQLREQYQRLAKTHDGDHRGFIVSRRTVCEQRDRIAADLAAARAERDRYREALTAASDAFESGNDIIAERIIDSALGAALSGPVAEEKP